MLVRRWKLLLAVVTGLALLVTGPQLVMRLGTWGERYSDAARTPKRTVALVFGAGLRADGTPTPFLQQRLDLAVDLIRAHRVRALLVTGDHGRNSHDEPGSMKAYLVAHGVPTDAVVEDHAGFSTYDSCYRAKAVFGIHDAVLISQGYHLPRAVFTCRQLGIDAVGLGGSELSQHRNDTIQYSVRELLSSAKAGWQLLRHPKPHFLGAHESGLDAYVALGRP